MANQNSVMSAQELKAALKPIREYYSTRAQKSIMRIFMEHLPSPDNVPVKARKMTTKLQAILAASPEEANDRFWDLWLILTNIVKWAPPDKHFQDTLVQVVLNISRLDSTAPNSFLHSMQWRDLHALVMCMVDFWCDPTEFEDFTEDDVKIVHMWMNTSSFNARLHALSLLDLGYLYPLMTVRAGLEETVPNGMKMDCRLWVATEWIIRCAPGFHSFLTTANITLDEQRLRSFRLGSLCGGEKAFPLISKERWCFWKQRLEEILDNWEDFELENVTRERIESTIQAMKSVEDGTWKECRPPYEGVEGEKHTNGVEDKSFWKRIRSILRPPREWCRLFIHECFDLLKPAVSSSAKESQMELLKKGLRKMARRCRWATRE